MSEGQTETTTYESLQSAERLFGIFNIEKYKNSITVHKLVEIILFRTLEIQIRLFKFELNDSMLKAKK